MTFVNITVAQMAALVRQRFKTATGPEACKMIMYVFNNYTDVQIKNYFTLTTAQLTAFKAKWQPKVSAWLLVRDAVGE